MKKALILVSVFVMSTAAYAMPNVGDEAMFAVTTTQSGQTLTGTMEFKLMSHDTTTDNWDEQITTSIAGQTSNQDQTLTSSSLLTDLQAQQILASCGSVNGALATITVPAGTFNTCAVPQNNNGETGTVWVADVTFGIVQENLTNSSTGQQITIQLQSQASGQ